MTQLPRTFTLSILCLFFSSTAFITRGNAASPALLLQEPPNLPNASAVVKPRVFVSLDPVVRGREFKLAIVVDIASGFHMNSHKPSEDYLIATTLIPKLPAG